MSILEIKIIYNMTIMNLLKVELVYKDGQMSIMWWNGVGIQGLSNVDYLMTRVELNETNETTKQLQWC